MTRIQQDGRSGTLWYVAIQADADQLSANDFAKYFSKKVSDIRATTDGHSLPGVSTAATADGRFPPSYSS